MNSPLRCYSEVEWRDINESSTDEATWFRNPSCPHEGEVRWCHVHLRAYERLSARQVPWLLFQTGDAFFNGWNTPEDLDALAIVEAEILDVAVGTSNSPLFSEGQWLQVRCSRVVPMADIPHQLPTLAPLPGENSRPSQQLELVSNSVFLDSWGGQVVEDWMYVSADGSGVPTHFVFYQNSVENKCELYNWPVK